MTDWVERDRGAIAFAEQLLTVLEEGSFTATYKYAVILPSLEHSTRAGVAPSSLTTRQLAEKVVELYRPQARAVRAPRSATAPRRPDKTLPPTPQAGRPR